MQPKGMTTRHDERLLRYVLAVAGVLLLICAIYAEEDWRGKHTWTKLKAQLEARGGHVDWTNYVPEAVPDDQNVFAVPEMKKWFVGRGATDLSSRLDAARTGFLQKLATGALAQVTVVKPGQKVEPGVADVVLDCDADLGTISLATEEAHARRADEMLPLIVMDEVPLEDAIHHLSQVAGLRYALDHKVSGDHAFKAASVSLRWTNISPMKALTAVLKTYQLQYVPNAKTGIGTIVAKQGPNAELGIEPTAREQLEKLLRQAVDGVTNNLHGQSATTAMGLTLTPGQPPQIKPVRIVVRADRNLETNEVAALFPMLPVGNYWSSRVQVTPSNSNTFEARLDVPPSVSASDFLKWSDAFAPDFDVIQEAVERPYAQMPGDYHEPVGIPIPNFVCIRIVAQTLTDRAKCHLLARQPEEALKDLALVRGLCRMLEGHPNKSSATLIATMINSAVTWLYTDTIAEGMRLKAWRGPELVELQKQLKEIDLPPLLQTSFEFERASHAKLLEGIKADEFQRIMTGGTTTKGFWQKMKDPAYLMLQVAPRGWVYQNLITMSRMNGRVIDGFDAKNRVISSTKVDSASESIGAEMKRRKPYNWLATIMMPNFTRAVQTLARNQCTADEALIACALERYRLAHGEYPNSLDALLPQYLDKLPTDIITGQPLKFRLKADGQFVLYSVGWNQKDDGGVSGPKKDGTPDASLGDWVWAGQ